MAVKNLGEELSTIFIDGEVEFGSSIDTTVDLALMDDARVLFKWYNAGDPLPADHDELDALVRIAVGRINSEEKALQIVKDAGYEASKRYLIASLKHKFNVPPVREAFHYFGYRSGRFLVPTALYYPTNRTRGNAANILRSLSFNEPDGYICGQILHPHIRGKQSDAAQKLFLKLNPKCARYLVAGLNNTDSEQFEVPLLKRYDDPAKPLIYLRKMLANDTVPVAVKDLAYDIIEHYGKIIL